MASLRKIRSIPQRRVTLIVFIGILAVFLLRTASDLLGDTVASVVLSLGAFLVALVFFVFAIITWKNPWHDPREFQKEEVR